jgi:5-methyltetrahydropteroyltriglutamate--homocysteine methyltransferase
MGRHLVYKSASDDEFVAQAERQLAVLEAALDGLPPDRLRLHVCWGNYDGPHHRDIALDRLFAMLMRARPQALLFEAANPRHAHEWTVFRDLGVPEGKVLVPGLIDSTTNFVEHPQLVAERIGVFVELVGRERVVAGTDCGMSTFAGFGAVDPEICYAKLRALTEGAAIASQRLRG